MEIKPTTRHKRLLENIPKNDSLGKAMIVSGYSEQSAKNPKKIMQTKGFQELLNIAAPDSLLLNVGVEGLHATKPFSLSRDVADYGVRHKYWETFLELKGKLQPGQSAESRAPIQINILVQQSLDKIYGDKKSDDVT